MCGFRLTVKLKDIIFEPPSLMVNAKIYSSEVIANHLHSFSSQNNPAATADITDSAEGITRAPLPPPSQEQNKAQNTAQWITNC